MRTTQDAAALPGDRGGREEPSVSDLEFGDWLPLNVYRTAQNNRKYLNNNKNDSNDNDGAGDVGASANDNVARLRHVGSTGTFVELMEDMEHAEAAGMIVTDRRRRRIHRSSSDGGSRPFRSPSHRDGLALDLATTSSPPNMSAPMVWRTTHPPRPRSNSSSSLAAGDEDERIMVASAHPPRSESFVSLAAEWNGRGVNRAVSPGGDEEERSMVHTLESMMQVLSDDDTLAASRGMLNRELRRLMDTTVSTMENTTAADHHSTDATAQRHDSFGHDSTESAMSYEELTESLVPLTSLTNMVKEGYRTTAVNRHSEYVGAPIPKNEEARLRALDDFTCVLRHKPISQAFLDGMTATFSVLSGLPTAAIALLGRDGHRFMSRHNFPDALAEANGHRREYSFSAWTLLSSHETGQVLIVDDARVHPMFSRHPAVTGAPCVRSYVSVPIVHKGFILGTICGFGCAPRSATNNGMTPSVFHQLRGLAELVATEFRKAEQSMMA
jgi:hypothetical protein